MRAIREGMAHGVLGGVGLLCGVLSGVALTVAAVASALLGLLAFAFSPLRAVLDRLRRG